MKITKLLQIAFFILITFSSSLACAKIVWIDVRSTSEYNDDHIDGDLRISHTEIINEIKKIYPDKNAEIHLYCRTGDRAGKAKSALVAVGYRTVINEGSIDDARTARGIDY